MENYLKPVILEFYGLPGSGKSTISHLVAERLRNQNYLVMEPTYELDHVKKPVYRKAYKAWVFVSWCVSRPKQIYINLKLVKRCGYKRLNDILIQCINITVKFQLLKRMERTDFIIFDEGFLQTSVSLSIIDRPDKSMKIANYLLKRISTEYEIKSFYIKADTARALKQMDNRKSNDSRIEKETNIEKKEKLMAEYLEACNSIAYPKRTIINIREYCGADSIANGILNMIRNNFRASGRTDRQKETGG